MSWVLAADSVTVTFAVLPTLPSATLTLAIAILGTSSLLRVTTALAAALNVALLGLVKLMVKVSFASTVVSPSTGTVKVLLVSPIAKVSVPVLAV